MSSKLTSANRSTDADGHRAFADCGDIRLLNHLLIEDDHWRRLALPRAGAPLFVFFAELLFAIKI